MHYKNTISICFLLFISTSCLKKHSCQCSVTYTKSGYSPFTTSTVEEIEEKCSKKRAERICKYTELQIEKNLSAGHKAANETISTSCAIK